MHTGDEVDSPATNHSTPPPTRMGEIVLPSPPTPVSVLRSIAAANGEPWFPALYAAETGLQRDSLDEPLSVLRLAGLVQAGTWVKGTGQGYVLTPEGRDAAATNTRIPTTADGLVGNLLPADPAANQPIDLRIASNSPLLLDARPPLIVPLLLIANVLCFFVGLAAAIRGGYPLGQYLGRGHSYILHRLGAVTGEDLLQGEWWRLFTSCFVHIGGLHLLVNLFALAMMGPLAELLWGRWRLAIIYVFSGLAGSCLAMANHPGGMLAGASGAIWGVLASLAAWLLLFRHKLPSDVAGDWARRLWLVFILNAGISLLPGISWEAHLGGGVGGFITAWLLNVTRFRTGWRRVVAAAALATVPVACLGGLAATIKWAGNWEVHRLRFAARQAQEARQAEAERQEQLAAAIRAYRKDLGPHLDRLNQPAVEDVEKRAWNQLLNPSPRRKQALADLRGEVVELKASADAVANHPDGPAVASEAFNQFRARAREMAQARSKSFSLLLQMIDSPADLDAVAWAAWNQSRVEADRLWRALGQP